MGKDKKPAVKEDKISQLLGESNTTDDMVSRALGKMLPQKENKSKVEMGEGGVSERVLDKLMPKTGKSSDDIMDKLMPKKEKKKAKKDDEEDVIDEKKGDESWFKKFFG